MLLLTDEMLNGLVVEVHYCNPFNWAMPTDIYISPY